MQNEQPRAWLDSTFPFTMEIVWLYFTGVMGLWCGFSGPAGRTALKSNQNRKEKRVPSLRINPTAAEDQGADVLTTICEPVQGTLGKKSPYYDSASVQSCCSVQSSTSCVLYFVNIRHFVWPLLLFALFLLIIFDFLLLLYQL